MQKTTSLSLPSVDWAGFQIAWKTRFGDDLNLVGHPNDPQFSPFTVQVPTVGQYWLTGWNMTSEAEFRDKVAGKKVALLVGCMDRRYARPLFDWAQVQARGQKVIPFFVAAGICQASHNVRWIAMSQMLEWLCANAKVTKIFASGHAYNCGGLAYIHGYQSVCNGIGCATGDQKELIFVEREISAGVEACVPQSHKSFVQKILVTEKGGRPLITKIY